MARLAVSKKLGHSTLDSMRCAVSGSGNVAQFACDKLIEMGAKVMTVSDSNGVMLFENGMTREDWTCIMECKNKNRGRLSSLKDRTSGIYFANQSPWTLDIAYDLALPCATENEIDGEAAQLLIKNGIKGIIEGANLPTTLEGQRLLRKHGDVIYIPGKAANAGGVGVSGFEMSQNAQRLTWSREEVNRKLEEMITNIFHLMEEHGETLEQGANIAGFMKVALAMKELGWVF
jgi:glutamate dehydrogenase (NADP+)